MTKVCIQVVEVLDNETERVVLDLTLAEFTEGAQFGEISDAKFYAQQVAERELKIQKRAAAKGRA